MRWFCGICARKLVKNSAGVCSCRGFYREGLREGLREKSLWVYGEHCQGGHCYNQIAKLLGPSNTFLILTPSSAPQAIHQAPAHSTKLSSSGSSLKKGLCSCSCWWTKFSMSTSKLAEVMHSEPCVACSHFSKSRVSSGNNGCLWRTEKIPL